MCDCRGLFFPSLVVAIFATGAVAGSHESEEGFVSLFNGKDLSGWELAGGKKMSFSVQDGTIYCDGSGNYPHWLRTKDTYENFVLRFEFKVAGWCENGVHIHAPLYGRCSKVGIEFQISRFNTERGPKETGAIFPIVAPIVSAARRNGEWNSAEIIMDWPTYRATLNGRLIQNINLEEHTDLRYRFRSGYIGLQDNGWKSWFRNIFIKRLPNKVEWIELFNGENLDGWETVGGGTWEVEDGTLVASNGHGYLVTDRQFRDFEIQMYVKTEDVANGGVHFRWWNEKDRGYEIQIFTNPDANHQTGSLYGIVRASHLPARDGEWFPMQIIVKDSSCIVRINGETVVDYGKLEKNRPGRIALQIHDDDGTIRFKDIRIRLL